MSERAIFDFEGLKVYYKYGDDLTMRQVLARAMDDASMKSGLVSVDELAFAFIRALHDSKPHTPYLEGWCEFYYKIKSRDGGLVIETHIPSRDGGPWVHQSTGGFSEAVSVWRDNHDELAANHASR